MDNWLLLGIAVFNALTAVAGFATVRYSRQTRELALKTEKNTNSMKDALVAATASSNRAEGRLEGVASEQDRVKTP